MFLSFVILLIISLSGLVITYLYEKESTFLARLAAGNIVGSAIFATVCFVLACGFGLSVLTVLAALLLTLLPLALILQRELRRKLMRDWQRAKGKLDGANFRKAFRFLYYFGFLLLLWLFFERAMIETKDGIFTGGSQNLGDLPFHLGAIFSFTEGNNFPPENPSFSGAKFTYPFLADFVTACLMKFGTGVREAMLIQNVFLGFSLVVLIEKFAFRLTENRLVGKIAPILLIFSGGLGFLWFFRDYWQGSQSLIEILWKLPGDYTIGEEFRWGNSLVALFLTQRSLLFGMPLTLIVLTKLWEIFVAGKERSDEKPASPGERNKNFLFSRYFSSSSFLVGLLAGTLPLIHVHSLAVLFVVCAFLFFFRLDKWRNWISFGLGVSLIAIPELIFSLTGSASNLREFFGWHFGWDAKNENFLYFWVKNTGLFIPLLAIGIFFWYLRGRNFDDEKSGNQKLKPENLLFFYIPFAFLFLISNTIKLAPWEWDNIKVLIYWFIGSLPFASFAIAWFWERNYLSKAVAVVCLTALIFSGALDVWRTISGQINFKVFSADAVKIAEIIRQKTSPQALFLNAPTYNSAVVLTGRRSFMRYSGHLSSYGIDYVPRENEVRRIYEGGPLAQSFLERNGIGYVIISPEETANLTVNETFFSKYQLIAQFGAYKVIKVK